MFSSKHKNRPPKTHKKFLEGRYTYFAKGLLKNQEDGTINAKKAHIIWFSICSVLILLTIFVATLGIMFSGGRNAASIFGNQLYLVRSDAFALVPSPSVVVGEKFLTAELTTGHLVIFETNDGRTTIGEIKEVAVTPPPPVLSEGESEENSDMGDEIPIQNINYNTVHFLIEDEVGYAHTISENSITSKVVRTSRFLGFVFNFAVSPLGVFIIAVIPCVCLILLEVVKPILAKRSRVKPVNKQDETPTFISTPPLVEVNPLPEHLESSDSAKHAPETALGENQARTKKQKKPPISLKDVPVKGFKGSTIPSSAGIDSETPESSITNVTPSKAINYAALKAYKDTLKATNPDDVTLNSENAEPELYRPEKPVSTTPIVSTKKQRGGGASTLSSVKLAEVIAASSAKSVNAPDASKLSHQQSSQSPKDILQATIENAKPTNSPELSQAPQQSRVQSPQVSPTMTVPPSLSSPSTPSSEQTQEQTVETTKPEIPPLLKFPSKVENTVSPEEKSKIIKDVITAYTEQAQNFNKQSKEDSEE